jgi:hypothetical protein
LTWEADFPDWRGILSTSLSFDQTTSSLVVVVNDSSNQQLLQIYNTVQNTLSTGVRPADLTVEYEVDNTQFAFAKYGSLASVTPVPSVESILVYPQPAVNQLFINASSDNMTAYTVVGLQGNRIASGTDFKNIDVSYLKTGIYFLRVSLKSGEVITTKFLKD